MIRTIPSIRETIEAVTGVAVDNQDIEVTVMYMPKMQAAAKLKLSKPFIMCMIMATKAADDHTDKVTFTREITKNLATGVVTYANGRQKTTATLPKFPVQ